MKIRVALVGVSGFAGVYYEQLLSLARDGEIGLVAATVINQEEEPLKCAALRTVGCKIYETFYQMLDGHRGSIDLCVIPTGIHLHAPMTIAALEAGCHVLLEKPAAATSCEVASMKAAGARHNRFVAIAYQHMYVPETHALKSALLHGLVGDVNTIKCLGLWPRDTDYYRRNNWAGKVKIAEQWVLDAPFNNAFAHWLNLMLFLAGSEAKTSATPLKLAAELYRTRDIESADTACMRIDTADGPEILFWVSHSSHQNIDPIMEVHGSNGVVRWAEGEITVTDRLGPRQFARCSDWATMRDRLIRSVLARVRGEPVFLCSLDLAGMQTACSEAAFKAVPIQIIPPSHLDRDPLHASEHSVIRHIEAACSEAFANNKLWSELPAVWSSPASSISVVTHHSLRSIEKATPIANLQAVPLNGEILQISSIG